MAVDMKLGEAFVELTTKGDTASLRRDMQHQADMASRGVAAKIGIDFDKANLRTAARSAASDAGREFGDGFTKDANGRLRDGRGRFASSGEESGRSWSKGFSRGTSGGADGVAGVIKSLASGLNMLDFGGPASGAQMLAAGALFAVGPVVALASSLGLASASAAAFIPAAFGAVTAVGTIALGFMGVMKTLKAYSAMQDAVSSQGAQQAKQEVSNAEAIRGAQERISDARKQQARTARDSAEQIHDAENRVIDSKKRVTQAQEDLNDAMAAAIKNIRDLKRESEDAAVSEVQAQAALSRAQLHLQQVTNDPKLNSPQAVIEARTDLIEAEQNLKDAKQKTIDTQKAAADADKKGVQRDKGVVDARNKVKDATKAVAEEERNLSLARQHAAEAQEDAAIAVARATHDLAQAQRTSNDAMSAGSSAASKYNAAFAKLTPQARAFVLQLISMQKYVDMLRATAERTMLPGLTDGLKSAISLVPLLDYAIGRTGTTIGNTGRSLGVFLESDLFHSELRTVVENNADAFDMFGRSATPIAGIVAAIAAAAAPLVKRFAQAWLNTTQMVAAWVDTKREGGQLQAFFKSAGDEAAKWFRILANIGGALWNVIKAALPSGQKMASTLESITARIKDWTGSASGQEKLKAFFAFFAHFDYAALFQVAAGVTAIGLALRALSAVGGAVSGIMQLVALGPVGLVIAGLAAGLAALVGIFVLLYSKSEPFRKSFNAFGKELSDFIRPIVTWFATYFRDVAIPVLEKCANIVLPALRHGWESITKAYKDNEPQIKSLIGLVRTLAAWFVEHVYPILAKVAAFLIGTFFDSISISIRVIANLVRAFQTAYSAISGWINKIKTVVTAIKTHFVSTFNGIAGALVGPVNKIITFINGMIGKINKVLPKSLEIGLIGTVRAPGSATGAKGGEAVFRASGGLLKGPGTGTSDDIPLWGSDGEYVVREKAVKKLGLGVMDRINHADKFDIFGDPGNLGIAKYADGGLINRTQKFIRGVDPLPYVWASVGPNAYDCSGLVGEVWNRLTGHASYHRRFTTANVANNFGFKPGHGTYTIGLSGSHVVGNLAGLAFEAASSRSGIKVGGNARSVDSMPRQFYLPQIGGEFVGGGGGKDGGFWGDRAAELFSLLVGPARSFVRKTTSPLGAPGVAVNSGFQGGLDNLKSRISSFDTGGRLPPGWTMAFNGTGKHETIRTAEQEAALNSKSAITNYYVTFNVKATDIDQVKKVIDVIEGIPSTAKQYATGSRR